MKISILNLTEDQETKLNKLTKFQREGFYAYYGYYGAGTEEISQKALERMKDESIEFAEYLEGIYENEFEFGMSLLDREYSGSVLYENLRHYIDGAKYAKDPLIDGYLGITYNNKFYVYYRNGI